MILKRRNLKLKKRREKRTTFVESDCDVNPHSEPKYKRIVCYENSESDIEF